MAAQHGAHGGVHVAAIGRVDLEFQRMQRRVGGFVRREREEMQPATAQDLGHGRQHHRRAQVREEGDRAVAFGEFARREDGALGVVAGVFDEQAQGDSRQFAACVRFGETHFHAVFHRHAQERRRPREIEQRADGEHPFGSAYRGHSQGEEGDDGKEAGAHDLPRNSSNVCDFSPFYGKLRRRRRSAPAPGDPSRRARRRGGAGGRRARAGRRRQGSRG